MSQMVAHGPVTAGSTRGHIWGHPVADAGGNTRRLPVPLTDAQCRNAKCPDGSARVRLADGQGMYLEVLPSGGRYWRIKYRIAGKEKRLRAYP